MKKIFIAVLALTLILSLCACAAKPAAETAAPAESTAPAETGSPNAVPDGELEPQTAANTMSAYVTLGEDKGTILADEVIFVTSADTEAMAKYNLTAEDMMDDYAIVNEEKAYQGYKLAADCRIATVFSDDGMDVSERTLTADEFEAYMAASEMRSNPGILANLVFDADGAVIEISEIFVP